jgi:YggT family protein
VSGLLCAAGQIYIILMIGRIILSWFPIAPDSPFAAIYHFLFAITEPLLGPVRRLIPPVRTGSMALDLSPIIVLLGLQLLVLPLVCN